MTDVLNASLEMMQIDDFSFQIGIFHTGLIVCLEMDPCLGMSSAAVLAVDDALFAKPSNCVDLSLKEGCGVSSSIICLIFKPLKIRVRNC